MMKIKLNKILLLLFLFSCSSQNCSTTSDLVVVERIKEYNKEVHFIKNGRLIQKIDSIRGKNWRPVINRYDTVYNLKSITTYVDSTNYLQVYYIHNTPSIILHNRLGKKDTLFFNYPMNYNGIVSLNKNLSWSDAIVQNGVDLLMKHCSTCHPFQTLGYSTIQKLDTTSIEGFRKNMKQIHSNSFADSTVNTISDKDLNLIRKIIKNAVREPEVVY